MTCDLALLEEALQGLINVIFSLLAIVGGQKESTDCFYIL
jgi:hypothetical protein